MNRNVLVIGNGFDLAHGIPSRYEEFIIYIKNKSYLSDPKISEDSRKELINIIETNGFIRYLIAYNKAIPGWVDLEREIQRIVKEFTYFFNNCSSMINSNNYLRRGATSDLQIDILLNFEIAKYITDGNLVEPKYCSTKYGLNKRAILRHLKQQLDSLIRALEIYLLDCQNSFAQTVTKTSRIPQIDAIKPQYVISFNYTNTYQIYGIKEEDVFHIHGKLEANNMVLGFDDYDPENLDFVYFKKYFQRIQKLTGYIDQHKLVPSNGSGYPISPSVHFYGHSMDKTDGDIIQQLKESAKEFIIYTYSQEDFEQKVINLIDIFGKDYATKMIQTKFIQFVPCE